jgi:superoxide dismutase, Cu-Zn family
MALEEMMKYAFMIVSMAAFTTACGSAPMEKTPETTAVESAPAAMAPETPAPDKSAPVRALATLAPTEGNEVTGTVEFVKEGDKVHVVAKVSGLSPGVHGFHVHEVGDCSAPDGTSAGGHFNPEGMQHGAPDAAMRHTGDLGNLEANDAGVAELDRVDGQLALDGAHSVVGRSVIVHADPDDLVSQPTGAAGARVACGVIELEANN